MKFNFEVPPPEETKPEEIKSVEPEQKKYGILESMYKSKFARAAAFAAAIGGALFEAHREYASAKAQTEASEMLEKKGVKLESLANKFKAEVQVPGGDKTILHIGQIHAVGSFKSMESGKETGEIIRSQKAVEELLTYLSENKLTDSVYVEGFGKGSVEFLKLQESDVNDTPLDSLAKNSKFLDLPELNRQDSAKAAWLYAAKLRLEKTIKAVEGKTKNLPEGSEEAKEAASRLSVFKEELSEIGSNKLIAGDNVYIWGAAAKMHAEGKINILPSETTEAREKTEAPYTLKEALPAAMSLGVKAEFRHREREDVAVKMVAQGAQAQNEKVIPLIYGDAHNFTESVTDFNKQSGHGTFGLTKVMPAEAK